MATISRLLKLIGLFCKIKSLLLGSFAKETYNLKEPTNRSHPLRPQCRGNRLRAGHVHTYGCQMRTKEPYKRNYILQKRPIILRSLLIVATPQSRGNRLRACHVHTYGCQMHTAKHNATLTATHTATHTATLTATHSATRTATCTATHTTIDPVTRIQT